MNTCQKKLTSFLMIDTFFSRRSDVMRFNHILLLYLKWLTQHRPFSHILLHRVRTNTHTNSLLLNRMGWSAERTYWIKRYVDIHNKKKTSGFDGFNLMLLLGDAWLTTNSAFKVQWTMFILVEHAIDISLEHTYTSIRNMF